MLLPHIASPQHHDTPPFPFTLRLDLTPTPPGARLGVIALSPWQASFGGIFQIYPKRTAKI